MAVDVLCSATSSPPVISPRISFSNDLKEVESIVAVESDHLHQSLLTIDFDFGVDQSFSSSHEISSADELFSNGRILPVQIKKTRKSHRTHEPDQAVTNHPNRKKPEPAKESPEIKKRLIELLSVNIEDEKQPNAKHFWQFRRSTSMNSEYNYRSRCNNNNNNNYGLLRPLNFLRRNNSTGSAPNPKQSPLPKSINKQHSLKEGSINCRENGSVNCNNQYYYYNHGSDNSRGRASLRKSMSSSNRSSSSYGNNGVVGVNISPVLNINPSYIAKGTVSLFGISSFFCRKKSKKKKK